VTILFPDDGTVRLLPAVTVALVGSATGLVVGLSDLGQRVEWALYDRATREAFLDAVPSSDVVVVAIDEASLSEVGLPLPWPRTLHAALIEQLSAAGARTIVFDVIFDLARDADEDEELARAIAAAGNVVLATAHSRIDDRGYSLEQWSDPIPGLRAAAAAVGVANVTLDPDGVARRSALTLGGRPSLALVTARLQPGFHEPDELDTPRLIPFRGPPRLGVRTYSYYQALEAETALPRGAFEGKLVFVGLSLTSPADVQNPVEQVPSPVGSLTPGIEIHARQLAALLEGHWVSDPFAAPAATGGLCLALAVPAAGALFLLGPLGGAGAVLGVVALLGGGAYGALVWSGVRLPVAAPTLTLAILAAAVTTYRLALAHRQRRMIRRAFEHYVAPVIVEEILADPRRLKLGGDTYEATVLFSDLVDFTAIAEGLSPAELRDCLSRYFHAMTTALLAERATIDKFIGDAIMAFFGCPVRNPEHPLQACRAALAMGEALDELNRLESARGRGPLRMRIGINTGPVVAGNIGTEEIFNYTVLGDAVNLASRLEGVNKEYGTAILIGEDTFGRIGSALETREIDWIRVKGRTRPVAIYEVAALAGALPSSRTVVFEAYSQGLARYRARDFVGARSAFERALERDPSDGPSRTFLGRLEEYQAAPPGPHWDGIFSLQHK
jgi:adenylate cyclase